MESSPCKNGYIVEEGRFCPGKIFNTWNHVCRHFHRSWTCPVLQWRKCWDSNHKSNSAIPHLLSKLTSQKSLSCFNNRRGCRPGIFGMWLRILNITLRSVKPWGMERLHVLVVCSSGGPRAALSGVRRCEHQICLDRLMAARGRGQLDLQLQIALFCTCNHL